MQTRPIKRSLEASLPAVRRRKLWTRLPLSAMAFCLALPGLPLVQAGDAPDSKALAQDIAPVAGVDRVVRSVRALTGLPEAQEGQVVQSRGFLTPGDGGGGLFRFDADSTRAHDGGRVVAPGAPDPGEDLLAYLRWEGAPREGRWLRVGKPGIANGRCFGARGDGKQDDGPALVRAALSVCEAGRRGVLFIPQGAYYIPERLPVYRGVDIRGDGPGRTVLERRDDSGYLVAAGHLGAGHRGKLGVAFSDLTLDNSLRLVLCHGVSEISFRNVEFLNGIVRFERSEYITIDSCTFRGNTGKAAYASSECSFVRITNNTIRNTELGGLNLSGHKYSVVANNILVKDELVEGVKGYGGIRLPNGAQFNTVTGNVIRNFPRGIFVLSGSQHNTIVGNVVDGAEHQGVLVQSDHNTLANNIIAGARAEAMRLDRAQACLVVGNRLAATHAERPALSLTSHSRGNRVLHNILKAPLGLVADEAHQKANVLRGNVNVQVTAQ